MAGDVCDCCGRPEKKVLGVASSSLGAVSWAWCRECLDACAEPEIMFEGLMYIGAWPPTIEVFRPEIKEYTIWKDNRYMPFEEWLAWRVTQPEPVYPED